MGTKKTIKSFTPGGPAMVAHFIEVADEVELRTIPVIGWILQASQYEDGDVEEVILAGVWDDGYNIVHSVEDMIEARSNCHLIGVYPEGKEASNEEIELAEQALLDDFTTQWNDAGRAQEPFRSKRQAVIAQRGKTLRQMVEASA